MSIDLERVRVWLHHQQQLGKAGKSAGDALRAVVGVYSSHPTAPLSLHARTKNLSAKQFRALEADKRAIRLGAMRGSIHFLPRETAPQVFAAAVGQTPKML